MKVIKEVLMPHDCQPELREASRMALWMGSIVECSCGDRYVCNDDQRDGLHWVRVPKPADGWPRERRPLVPETEDGIVVDGSCWCLHSLDDHNGNGCTVQDGRFWNGRCQCIVGVDLLKRKLQEAIPAVGEVIDQSSWPAHLRDDAPSQRCSRCGRNTWAVEEFGAECRMTQPSGQPCGGRFGT